MVLRRIGLSGCSLRNLAQICRASRWLPLAQSTSPRCAATYGRGTAQGLAQQAFGFVEVAQAVIHPAQAVQHCRVFRVELVRLFDQDLGLGIARCTV